MGAAGAARWRPLRNSRPMCLTCAAAASALLMLPMCNSLNDWPSKIVQSHSLLVGHCRSPFDSARGRALYTRQKLRRGGPHCQLPFSF